MTIKDFLFKQFKIQQDKTAMKVGTDGVLLGAWADTVKATNVLDIGTGTGLIALMLAQRNQTANISAIEIDKQASLQALGNFDNSPWRNRLSIINIKLQDFTSEGKFDLIVSNPPFFNNTYQANSSERNIARQTETLGFNDLLKNTASLLSGNGKACFVLPFLEMDSFISLANTFSLFPNKILLIKGNINTENKRFLIEFSFNETVVQKDTLVIEIARHHYTEEYIELVQDFYFKM